MKNNIQQIISSPIIIIYFTRDTIAIAVTVLNNYREIEVNVNFLQKIDIIDINMWNKKPNYYCV